MITRSLRVCLALVASLLALVASPSAAHLTPNSEVRLHLEPGGLRADLLIPAAEYAYATGLPADGDPASLNRIGRYVLAHAQVRAPDGRAWRGELGELAVVSAAGGPDIVGTLRFAAPDGTPDRRFTLRWDAVIEGSPDHYALLAITSDLAGGLAEGNDLLGAFSAGRTTIAVDRGAGGTRQLFAGALRLGAHHIIVGHDHLLFLLALLLPAPLLAAGGRWDCPREPRRAIRDLAMIVTAFTIGHSLTLIAAALFGISLPAPPVEAAIALSVLISAVHAWRPLFPGREPIVAGLFGLIHGLAFATIVISFGAASAGQAVAILGFNLGIELVQLAIVAALLPALLLGARTRFYHPARRFLSALAALAALAWLVERLSGRENPVAGAFAALLPPLALALLAASLALGLAWVVQRRDERRRVAGAAGQA